VSKPDYALIRFKSPVNFAHGGRDEWDPKSGSYYSVEDRGSFIAFVPKQPLLDGPGKGRVLVVSVPLHNIASISTYEDIAPAKTAEVGPKAVTPKAKAQEPAS
jgi:hypothetical protein